MVREITSSSTTRTRADGNGMLDGKEEPRFSGQVVVFEQNVTELVNLLAKISPEEVVREE